MKRKDFFKAQRQYIENEARVERLLKELDSANGHIAKITEDLADAIVGRNMAKRYLDRSGISMNGK